MLRGHVCKIVQMSTSQPGKHGHAKVKNLTFCQGKEKYLAKVKEKCLKHLAKVKKNIFKGLIR